MDRRAFCMGATLALAMPVARAGGPGAAGRADFSWLDARLAARVAAGYFDGMSLVVGRGERIVHQAWFGDGGADAVQHVASTGKWTAVATIASVVDQGKLSWDDTVAKFLPEFSDIKGQATLRQLLSHTAGYPDYQPAAARRDDYPALAEAVAHIVELPALAAPGQRFQYGGLAMQVAGRMAELAAGMDFDQIFQRCLAGPLGMRHSGYAPVSTEPGFSPMLGGSLFTCAADYARFLMMFSQDGVYQGKRILSRAAIGEIGANQIGAASVQRGEYVESARQDLRQDIYGLGVWREEVDAERQATLLSSPGWAGAYAWLDRKAGSWGVVIAKANVAHAVADGYNTFLGSSIYAPMARAAIEDAGRHDIRRRIIPVHGGTLYCEESGRGEPVILLHGHSLDRRQWQPQIAALQARYRVIRYDLRGYGRSSLPDEQQTVRHADDLLAVMEALRLPRAHLVGHSLGGLVLTDFIALHPRRAISAVMVGGDLTDAPGPDQSWTAPQRQQRQDDIAALKREGISKFKQRWLRQLVDGSSAADSLRQQLWPMIDEWQAWQPLHIEPRLLLGRAAAHALRRNAPALPALIVRGAREKTDWSITELLPQARRAVVASSGHMLNLEQPARFNAVLLAWLDGYGEPVNRQ